MELHEQQTRIEKLLERIALAVEDMATRPRPPKNGDIRAAQRARVEKLNTAKVADAGVLSAFIAREGTISPWLVTARLGWENARVTRTIKHLIAENRIQKVSKGRYAPHTLNGRSLHTGI